MLASLASAKTVLSIAYWFLKLANGIFESIQQDKLIALGEDRQSAKALLALNENSKALKEVDERFDKMTDAEIKAKLEADGDFRD